MKKLIAGNWKMNGSLGEVRELIADVINRLYASEDLLDRYDFLVCPPTLHLPTVRHAVHGYPRLAFGGQDCSAQDNGAHTGDISAAMFKDSSCSYIIVGHSERRANHGEDDAMVKAKAAQVLANDMVPIICVGETEAQRDAGEHLAIVEEQLRGSLPARDAYQDIVVAYEPVWAIGTGKACEPPDITEMHAHIRGIVGDKVRILYGGSLKPENAGEILPLPNVDGGLIGGASLRADSFLGIARAI